MSVNKQGAASSASLGVSVKEESHGDGLSEADASVREGL